MDEIAVITEPKVWLVGRSTLDILDVQDFLDEEAGRWVRTSEYGTELLTELAGRVCYMSFGEKQGRKDTESYLRNIIESGHGSVLEHATWTFIITGVSRSFSHELVRHRAGVAFSQLSQRYVDESDTAFVVPPLVQEAHEHNCSAEKNGVNGVYGALYNWRQAMGDALDHYRALVEQLDFYLKDCHPEIDKHNRRKMVREAARSVLPNATETKIVFSANARALRHIIEYRGSEHAEAEIRRVAIKLLQIMVREAPTIFGDYRVEMGPSSFAIKTEHEKV